MSAIFYTGIFAVSLIIISSVAARNQGGSAILENDTAKQETRQTKQSVTESKTPVSSEGGSLWRVGRMERRDGRRIEHQSLILAQDERWRRA